MAERYAARIVRPVSGPDIENGAVVVEGDVIVYVGPRSGAPSGRETDLGDVILGPGLVNAHTHLDLTVLRGLFDGLQFFEWIRALTAARAALTPEELLESARSGIREGIRAGITTFADTAPNDAPFSAMLELGVRGIAYREVFGPDPAQCDASMAALRESIAAMRPRETALVRAGISPHAPYSVSDELFAAAALFAGEERLPLATHVAESLDESRCVTSGEGPFADFLRGRGIAVAARGRTPVALLERNGVLGAHTLLIHCIRCDDRDIATIAKHRCGVATCPVSNRFFAHGAARVGAMLLESVNVGVGTDSMASNERMDVLAEARLALGERGTERAAWDLATLGGARALGMHAETGSLDIGKQADLAAFTPGKSPAVFVAVAGRVLIPSDQ
ncbi:MAG TPA: amidohydrolase family protein [Gemmatimonadaceae bacterium]|nr:amidohydrolase family protein [Gemmatimonadaceae bacterium]